MPGKAHSRQQLRQLPQSSLLSRMRAGRETGAVTLVPVTSLCLVNIVARRFNYEVDHIQSELPGIYFGAVADALGSHAHFIVMNQYRFHLIEPCISIGTFL